MSDILTRVEKILEEIKEQIVHLTSQKQFNLVDFYMEQYIKLSPNSIDRYSLEAIIKVEKADFKSAEEILKRGLLEHPLSFDLLYNLGYVYQQSGECLDAYNIYMKAKYVAHTVEEKADIEEALRGLVKYFTSYQKFEDDKVINVIGAGDVQLEQTLNIEGIKKRKNLLHIIENNIDKNSSSVLEIGFEDGIISKNLNYQGFDVTGVDRIRERILNVIAIEWHDNLLQPEQRTAKYYHEPIGIEWMNKIPEFDVIVAVAENNLNVFDITEDQKLELLESLLFKAKKQLFIRVSSSHSDREFNKNDIDVVLSKYNYNTKVINTVYCNDGTSFELYRIEKYVDIEPFSVPLGLDAINCNSSIIEVELSKCVDMYGASYIGDFQHFVEVLKEYLEDPDLKYENSILKSYYETFNPNNLEEGLFSSIGRAPKLRQGWIGYPWNWDKSLKVVFSEKVEDTRPGGNHHFGENTLEFGENEFNRLINLYKYFARYGYQPEAFSDGYISGYLLYKGEDYRFVITEGQHRVACLAALGYDKIRCRFTHRLGFPRIVDYKDIKAWPQVENGAYSKNLAGKVFDRFFEKNVGKDRMRIKE